VTGGAGETEAADLEVRGSGPADECFAENASALIRAAAVDNDIALRSVEWLSEKLRSGKAALAIFDGELVGFGYWSAWEGGAFVSHSGLVVRSEAQGRGLGRRLKLVLLESGRKAYPDAKVISLTTHPAIKRLNRSLGFVDVAIETLTRDPDFWAGCAGCRNYPEVKRRGGICCCDAMMLDPKQLEMR